MLGGILGWKPSHQHEDLIDTARGAHLGSRTRSASFLSSDSFTSSHGIIIPYEAKRIVDINPLLGLTITMESGALSLGKNVGILIFVIQIENFDMYSSWQFIRIDDCATMAMKTTT